MQRKAMLAGLTVALLLTALTAFSQCRAGLFDGLFRKDKGLWKSTQPRRRPPCRSCTYGFHATTWRPWGTCCDGAPQGNVEAPWSDSVTLPMTDSYGTNGVPYDSSPETPPDGFQPIPHESLPLRIPEESPSEDRVPTGSSVIPPFEPDSSTTQFDDTVPSFPDSPNPRIGSTSPLFEAPLSGRDEASSDQLTRPDRLLIPPAIEPAVPLPGGATRLAVPAPLPTLSTIPGPPTAGAPLQLQPRWQPMSYSEAPIAPPRSTHTPAPSRSPQRQRSNSSQWRVMPGFYAPQQPTRPSDRVLYAPPTRR